MVADLAAKNISFFSTEYCIHILTSFRSFFCLLHFLIITLFPSSLFSGLAVEPNAADATPRDSVFDLAERASGNEGEEERPRRTITMYRNGFQVDDGPYRRLDDPANADFLRSLASGRTPRELLEEGDVTVGLIDKRSEDYVEQFSSFSGEGTSLGSAAAASTDGVMDPSSLPEPPPLDESSPTTSIQVRMMNGQRRVIKINTSATVLQLASHLSNDSAHPFVLVSGFPPKPITNVSQTLEECGLKGAQVMQKPAS